MNNKDRNILKDLNIADFKSLKLLLAKDEDIKNWSYGEVTKLRLLIIEPSDLRKTDFLMREFLVPTKDWECYCGKYKRIRYRGIFVTNVVLK